MCRARSSIGSGLKYHLILYYKISHSMDTKLIIIFVLFTALLIMFVCEYGGKSKQEQFTPYPGRQWNGFAGGCGCQNKPMIKAASINGPPQFVTGQAMVVNNLSPEINKPLIITPSKSSQPSQSETAQALAQTNQKIANAPTTSLNSTTGIDNIVKTNNKLPPNNDDVRSITVVTGSANKKTDLKEPGIVKFVFYHMNGCGHCSDFMKIPKVNGKTKFELLTEAFANDPKVKVVDFQYGRDKEANKFTAFPMIYILSDKGVEEYNGPLEVNELIKAINKHK